jgi:acetamidase/formamidase
MDGTPHRPGEPGVHTVCRAALHNAWDAGLAPAVEIDPGDVVELAAPDASDDQITGGSDVAALSALDFSRMNPVAGPVFVRGARPGDALEVEILDVRTRTWGWTAIVPGFGLMADEYPGPWLGMSSVERDHVRFGQRARLPYRPFPGTIGVVPAEPGRHSVLPPSRFGGNLDVRHLTVGSTLLLPVGVDGALLSVGDGHAVQGDGEVCGSAVETGMEIVLRVGLRRGLGPAGPQVHVPRCPPSPSSETRITTGVAEDLHEATRAAVRAMIAFLVDRHGLEPLEAYALTSVAADLRIHEVVNAPRWVVGAAIATDVLVEA